MLTYVTRLLLIIFTVCLTSTMTRAAIEDVINLNTGALSITDGDKINVTVYGSENNFNGTRDTITSFRPRRPLMPPAGKYVVSGKQDGEVIEVEAEVRTGELTEVELLA